MSGRGDKKTGLAHLFAATRYSAQGFVRALAEAAFRHELMMAFVIIGAMLWAGCPAADIVLSAILLLVLLAVEAINTAIEEVIDRISPELSSTARHAKDLGSLAVFFLIVANLGFAAFSLWRALSG